MKLASEKRILASQINGKKSRGPQTWAGKMIARQNSYRHGLSTIHRSNPIYADEIAGIVTYLCAGCDSQALVEQAAVIAECSVLLRAVRGEQAAAIDWFRDAAAVDLRRKGSTLARARANYRQLIQALDELERLGGVWARYNQTPLETGKARGPVWTAPKERTLDQAMRAAMPALKRLERYERRAWSRRVRALDEFNRIKSQPSGTL